MVSSMPGSQNQFNNCTIVNFNAPTVVSPMATGAGGAMGSGMTGASQAMLGASQAMLGASQAMLGASQAMLGGAYNGSSNFTATGIPGVNGQYAYVPGSAMAQFLDGMNASVAGAMGMCSGASNGTSYDTSGGTGGGGVIAWAQNLVAQAQQRDAMGKSIGSVISMLSSMLPDDKKDSFMDKVKDNFLPMLPDDLRASVEKNLDIDSEDSEETSKSKNTDDDTTETEDDTEDTESSTSDSEE